MIYSKYQLGNYSRDESTKLSSLNVVISFRELFLYDNVDSYRLPTTMNVVPWNLKIVAWRQNRMATYRFLNIPFPERGIFMEMEIDVNDFEM